MLTLELLRFLTDLSAGWTGSAAATGEEERREDSRDCETWDKTVKNTKVELYSRELLSWGSNQGWFSGPLSRWPWHQTWSTQLVSKGLLVWELAPPEKKKEVQAAGITFPGVYKDSFQVTIQQRITEIFHELLRIYAYFVLTFELLHWVDSAGLLGLAAALTWSLKDVKKKCFLLE